MRRAATVAFLLAAFPDGACQAGNEARFEGTVSATLTRAGNAEVLVFTRKGDLLRIENTTDKLDPINIVDLGRQKLTIIYAHNTTFVHVDLKELQRVGDSPAMPANETIPMIRSRAPGTNFGGKISSSALPSPPPVPSGLPMSNMGGAGMMVPPLASSQRPLALKQEEKKKRIHGFDCALYTVGERWERFEIWASNDAPLFPFRLIERNYTGRSFGPSALEERWVQSLREKSLFPLQATLHSDETNEERFSFKIDKIERRKIDDEALFRPPKKYLEIQAPRAAPAAGAGGSRRTQ